MLATLQKFSLRHHDLPTMIWNVAVLLRMLALEIDSRHTKQTPIIIYVTSAIFMVLYLYVYHLSTYWFIFWRGGGTKLFNILLISLTISSSIGVIKLLFMYFNRTKLKKLVSEYLECDASLVPGSRMSRNVNAALRSVKRRAVIFWMVLVWNGILYDLRGIITPGRHFPEDDQVLLGLEPMYESPNFELANVALFCGIIFSVAVPANITAFIIVFVGYNEAQMRALAQELLHLWDDAQSYYLTTQPDFVTDDSPSCSYYSIRPNRKQKERILNEYIRQRLVIIIKGHATNINLIKQVESIYKSAIAVEFGLLSCGLIAELLGGLENTYLQVPFAFAQVSMDCLTGQKLMDASNAFEKAVYACQWERFDVKNRKLVLVMLQIAQKNLQLSVGGLTSLSYSALMSVIKSIYSAYTALRSTLN